MASKQNWKAWRRERMELLAPLVKELRRSIAIASKSTELRQLLAIRAQHEMAIAKIDAKIERDCEQALDNYKALLVNELEFKLLTVAKTDADIGQARLLAQRTVAREWAKLIADDVS